MQILDHLSQQLGALPPDQHYVVAYSGGLDSHVLLKTISLWRDQTPEISVKAVHVHHGLSSQADHWVEHCRRVAHQLQIDFSCEYLNGVPPQGSSVEAWARESRYTALAKHVTDGRILLTAHTQDDQAETVLLQLLRGAGPKGLAAMPQQQTFASGRLLRPFLNLTRACLQEFAEQNSLIWLEDDSNTHLRFDRNFIRHRVAPILRERWPGFAKNIARSAQHNAEAAANLNELASSDLGEKDFPETLPLELLRDLSAPRQRNVLRYWLSRHGCRLPNTRQMRCIQQDLIYSRRDSQPQVRWGESTIRRFRQNLIINSRVVHHEELNSICWDLSEPLVLPQGLGRLQAIQKLNGGLSLKIDRESLSIRFRRGGERCRISGKSQSTSLKKLFQEWNIPPWQRPSIPLLFQGDELIAMIGFGVCSDFATAANEMGWCITLEKRQD